MKKKIKLTERNYLLTFSPISSVQRDINFSALIISFFLFFLLILLKPLFLSSVSNTSLYQIAFITAFIPVSIGWIYNSNLYKKANKKDWSLFDDIFNFLIVKSISLIIYLFYVYAIFNYIYVEDLKKHNWDFNRNVILETIPYFLYIGTVLFFLLKFIDFIRFFKTNQNDSTNKKSDLLNKNSKSLNSVKLVFFGKNKGEFLKINKSDFLYIESSGHYVKIYHRKSSNEIKMTILRNSINNVIENCKEHDNVFQCHRSFVINTDIDFKIEGNSQKANILLKDIDSPIPLSRKKYNILINRVI